VGGTDRIARREDCELIFLVGLPGSGKTTWANNYVQEHPEKRFNVIGTAALLEHMKVRAQ
jgi:heterogeneous nuclear ribonucleoprotein U-like protein 1